LGFIAQNSLPFYCHLIGPSNQPDSLHKLSIFGRSKRTMDNPWSRPQSVTTSVSWAALVFRLFLGINHGFNVDSLQEFKSIIQLIHAPLSSFLWALFGWFMAWILISPPWLQELHSGFYKLGIWCVTYLCNLLAFEWHFGEPFGTAPSGLFLFFYSTFLLESFLWESYYEIVISLISLFLISPLRLVSLFCIDVVMLIRSLRSILCSHLCIRFCVTFVACGFFSNLGFYVKILCPLSSC